MRPFLTIRGPIASFGVGMVGFKNCFTVSSFIPITFVFLVWLDSNYILEFWICMVMVVVGGSQQLLSFNPTTVLVVLLLGLMLGCYKSQRYKQGDHMDRLTHRLTNSRSEKHKDRDR